MFKKIIVFVLSITTVFNIFAMSPLSELPKDLKQLIIMQVAYSNDAEEAAQALRSLAVLNRQFRSFFEKEDFMGQIINLMPTNKMSKFEIALRLGMPTATSWLKNNLHNLRNEFKQDVDKKKLSLPAAGMIILAFLNDQMINDQVWQELLQKYMSVRVLMGGDKFLGYRQPFTLEFNDQKTHQKLFKTVYASTNPWENGDILFYAKDVRNSSNNEIFFGLLADRRILKSLILSYPQSEALAPLAGGWLITKAGTKTVWIVAPLAGEDPEGDLENMKVRIFIVNLNKEDQSEKTFSFNSQIKEPQQ